MTTTSPKLKVINNHAYANSLDLAKHFHKRHDDVLRIIRRKLSECSNEFSLRNFAERNYKNSRGRIFPYFELTKNGFAMITFAFTGKEATAWTESYITKFDELEIELRHAKARIETLEQLEMFPEMLREREYTIAEVQTKLSDVGLFTPRTTRNAIKRMIQRDGSLGRFDGVRWLMNESGLKSLIKREQYSA
jgi:Rha family phage regulatory protein